MRDGLGLQGLVWGRCVRFRAKGQSGFLAYEGVGLGVLGFSGSACAFLDRSSSV